MGGVMHGFALGVFACFAWFQQCNATTFNGIVGSAVASVFDDVRYAYTFSQPSTNLVFTSGSGAVVIQGMQTHSYDYGVSYEPANIGSLPEQTKFFPFGAIAFITPINIPELPLNATVVFDRETLCRIFLGEISMWNDDAILHTNPNISMPNRPINVVLRQNTSGSTGALTLAFESFTDRWPYGAVDVFPPDIYANNSRFFPVGSNTNMFAKIVDLKYSIGYTTLNTVMRQNAALIVPRMINKAGKTVAGDQKALNAAMNTATLDARGTAEFIDPDHSDAWPIGHFLYGIVSTEYDDPEDCANGRELAKFFNWILNFDVPHDRMTQDGAVPLSVELTKIVNDHWASVECEVTGKPILAYEVQSMENSPALTFLIAVDLLMIVTIIVLAVVNLHIFRTPIINVIYTSIFSVGSVVLFTAPPLFALEPSKAVCSGRVWLTSLGFSLVLGTMFSRTWQLREIYLLQKKQMDRLMNVTVTSSLVKLIVSMSIVLVTILVFLGTWQGIDPYRPELISLDSLNLVGEMECVSDHFWGWIVGLGVLILILIAFGIYVIYQTWSFQRKALLAETRWVLFALYNVLLNLVAVSPILSLAKLSQVNLAIVLCVTIIFSGSGIIFAVMLPRVVNKLEWSTDGSHSKNSGNNTPKEITVQTRTGTHKDSVGTHKTKKLIPKTPTAGGISEDDESLHPGSRPRSRSHSRTPEADLVRRLETPERLQVDSKHNVTITHEFGGRESPISRHSVIEMETLKSVQESPAMSVRETSPTMSPEDTPILCALSSSQHPPPGELSWSPNPLENIIKNT